MFVFHMSHIALVSLVETSVAYLSVRLLIFIVCGMMGTCSALVSHCLCFVIVIYFATYIQGSTYIVCIQGYNAGMPVVVVVS